MPGEKQFKTSFIPKGSITPSSRSAKKSKIDFLYLVSLFVFLASIALAAGVFVYSFYLEQRIGGLKADVEKSREAFEPNFIAYAVRLDSRIDNSEKLLAKHIAPSEIFDALERNTLKTISFDDYSYVASPDGQIKVSMSGVARDYESIALQSDRYADRSTGFKEPVFSSFNLTQDGNIAFSFQSFVDVDLIAYQNIFSDREIAEGPDNDQNNSGNPFDNDVVDNDVVEEDESATSTDDEVPVTDN